VKVEPESLGLGMYQHDINSKVLHTALSGVVESCVSSVGVDLNTASSSLLGRVAGLTKTSAKKIVTYREKNGAFPHRDALRQVTGIGAKSYEQCAGFLRVYNGSEPLDTTEVHPESYDTARSILKHLGTDAGSLLSKKTTTVELEESRSKLGGGASAEELSKHLVIGSFEVEQVLRSLRKPGHDPRDEFDAPMMRDGKMTKLSDLVMGTPVSGVVRNVVPFGAFVDIGVGTSGLFHISQMRHLEKGITLQPGLRLEAQIGPVDVQRQRVALYAPGVPIGENGEDLSPKPPRRARFPERRQRSRSPDTKTKPNRAR